MVSAPLIGLRDKKSLLYHFAKLNIKSRFKGTYLGLLWAALEPALIFVLLYVVFTSIKIRGGENFAIYLLTGIIIYHIFSRGTLAGLSSLQSNSGLLQSFNIKKEFFPVSVALATGILVLIEVGVFFGLMTPFDFVLPWTVIAYPLVLLLLMTLILGLSYLLSVAYVYFKDVQIIWAIVIHAIFFISPIFWYVGEAEGVLLWMHRLNPIGQIIEIAHNLIVLGQIPPLFDWLYTSAFVVGIFFLGYAVFQKKQNKLVEEL